jgi:hypothetical protein
VPHRKLFNQSQEVAGDLAAGVSAATAGWTWIATANELLQMVATTIAIIAGIYAIVWHRVRINQARKADEQSK